MKEYYLYGENGQFLGSLTASKRPENSVDFAPPLGTISAKLNESKTDWIVISSIDNADYGSDDGLKQLSQLALQQAQFQASQQKLNSQLALQLATLTAKEAK